MKLINNRLTSCWTFCQKSAKRLVLLCMAVQLLTLSQLYGGKICAALDRQHPRDLFAIKLLLDSEGLTDEIRQGLIYGLVSSNRPTHELLRPRLQDQRTAFDNQFEGMSTLMFSYEDYERTRLELIELVNGSLTDKDRAFLLSVNRLKPDWGIYDFQNFPSVKWKLSNLEKFKQEKNEDYLQQYAALESILSGD